MPLEGKTQSGLLRGVTIGGPIMAVAATLLLDTYTNAMAAYSYRKLRAAYAGSAVRIRRSSDSAEADIGFDGSNDFDTGAASSHIGGGSGFIVTWYDQSGNANHVTQATAGQQPPYNATGMVGLPTSVFVNASSTKLDTGSGRALNSTDLSGFAVARYTTSSANTARILSVTADFFSEDFNNTPSGALLARDTGTIWKAFRNSGSLSVNTGVSADTDYVFGSIFDGANHTLYLDGSGSTPVSSTGSFGQDGGARVTIGSDMGSFGPYLDGRISEAIIWASDQTSNVAGITADQSAYWGI